MFKKAVLVSAAALALATIASPALAQSFTPVNSSSTLSGSLNLEQSQNIDCDVTVEIDIDNAGAAEVTFAEFAPGTPFLCGLIVQPDGDWTVTAGPGLDEVTLEIGASSILGSCFGELVVPYIDGELIFEDAEIPGDPGPCYINGSLFADPELTIVP